MWSQRLVVWSGAVASVLASVATPAYGQSPGTVTPLSHERFIEASLTDIPTDTEVFSGTGAFKDRVSVRRSISGCLPMGAGCFDITLAASEARQDSLITMSADGVLEIQGDGSIDADGHAVSRLTSTFAVDGTVPYTLYADGRGPVFVTLTDAVGEVLVAHRTSNGKLTDNGRLPTGTYTLLVEVSGTGSGDFDAGLTVGGAVPPWNGPRCLPEVFQRSYAFGAIVRGVIGLENFGPDAVAVELKIWIRLPNGINIPARSGGEDGTLFMHAGAAQTFQLDLFGVGPEIAPGTYAFACRLLDPTTGARLDERSYVFTVQ